MQEAANKQKRITLKIVHEMLDGMSVELAEKVHLLFMANYIDYSDYEFRDESQVEGYCWCYRDLFELKTKESQDIVNSQLIEFLDEWRQDAPFYLLQRPICQSALPRPSLFTGGKLADICSSTTN